ncbi:MAG: hypothetical protein JXQ87_11085 [Bacteroidia bacterium]
MLVTRLIFFCLISIVFFAKPCFGNEPKPGILVLKNGDTLQGFISYRKIDVPTRVLFQNNEGAKLPQNPLTKTLYGPNELSSFTYGNEQWYSISFTKKELGYKASYFLKVIETKHNFSLLGGIVTAEGCNCSGTKINATYHWLLLDTGSKQRIILAKKRHGKIENPEWVSAFYSGFGFDIEPFNFIRPKKVLYPINE